MENRKQTFSILLLGTQMATGGAQKGLLDQAHWFHSHGCNVTAAFFYDKENLHAEWQEMAPFPIINLNAYLADAGVLRQIRLLMAGLWRLWKLLRQGKFEVVETFTHDSNLLGLPFAWLAGVPARVATHRGEIEGFSGWLSRLHKWLINVGIADALIAVSEKMRQNSIADGVNAKKIHVILSGIEPLDTKTVNRADARKDLGIGENDLFLLTVGRLTYQKAHEVFVEAMAEVVQEFPNAQAAICGDGPLRPQLESQIKELGLTQKVMLLGLQNDVARLLAAADIFVLPSRWEGLPRALLEAMAAGLPVIATRVDGTQELIDDEVTGLLAPAEDSHGLAESILRLATDAGIRNEIARSAQSFVMKKHTLDRMCQKYYEYILGILHKR